MTLYIVEKLSLGDWRAYSTFDEKILAIDAAKDLMRGDRAPAAVRVMEETEPGAASRMVFRQTASDEEDAEILKRRRADMKAAEDARRIRTAKKQEIRAGKAATARQSSLARADEPGFTALMIRLTLLLVAGLGALGALRFYYYG
jgi:hypothetical protein